MNFLEDGEIILRPLELSDAEGDYPNWLNDMETSKGNSHHRFPYSRDEAREYIQNARVSENDVILAIVERCSGKHIGNIALLDICWFSHSAKFAILVGSSTARGKGIGFRAGKLVLAHGFMSLNLHRIYCGTYVTNVAMNSLAKKLGMTLVGTLRESAYKDGLYLGENLFDILRPEYLAKT